MKQKVLLLVVTAVFCLLAVLNAWLAWPQRSPFVKGFGLAVALYMVVKAYQAFARFLVLMRPTLPDINDPALPGRWAENPEHPVSDWRYEVENGDTRLGYWEWVRNQQERAS